MKIGKICKRKGLNVKFLLLTFTTLVFLYLILVSTYLAQNDHTSNASSSLTTTIYKSTNWKDSVETMFIKALKLKTILANTSLEQYREDSIRYVGQQHQQRQIGNLLRRIFEGNKLELNILITGGSISQFRA